MLENIWPAVFSDKSAFFYAGDLGFPIWSIIELEVGLFLHAHGVIYAHFTLFMSNKAFDLEFSLFVLLN